MNYDFYKIPAFKIVKNPAFKNSLFSRNKNRLNFSSSLYTELENKRYIDSKKTVKVLPFFKKMTVF